MKYGLAIVIALFCVTVALAQGILYSNFSKTHVTIIPDRGGSNRWSGNRAKQGTCPVRNTWARPKCNNRQNSQRCRNDYQCRGNQKCCDSGCGYECVEPGRLKHVSSFVLFHSQFDATPAGICGVMIVNSVRMADACVTPVRGSAEITGIME